MYEFYFIQILWQASKKCTARGKLCSVRWWYSTRWFC